MHKLPVIIAFNAVIAIADIALLSRGLLSFTGIAKVLILIVSIIFFIVGNYFLLSSAFKKPVLKNKVNADSDDFESAFKGWKSMNTPFGRQIEAALKQIDKLESRKQKLSALSNDNMFESAVDEVQSNMFHNFNRIINRFIIYDKADINDINRNIIYINGVLETNEKYLDVFRKFIDEISMLGDPSDNDIKTLTLQTITESLKDIRTNGTASFPDDSDGKVL